MELIDKADVVAEIERRIEENKTEIQRATDKHLEEYFEHLSTDLSEPQVIIEDHHTE